MTQSFLMCSPDYFGVQYSINPWMTDTIGKVDSHRAARQWEDFFFTLARFAKIQLLPPKTQVPDLVFTANAGLLLNNKFIPSRFRHSERREEEPFFRDWFQSHGYQVADWPDAVYFEGAGDALPQPGNNLLWAANGFRTDAEAHDILASEFQIQVVSLQLVNPNFYHLDTCFCPLQEGKIMYYPKAFDAQSLNLIEKHTAPENRIPVSDDDARHFACNAVLVGTNIILNRASRDLRDRLTNAGYRVIIKPVTEFMKAGGANKCLTFELHSDLEKNQNDEDKNETPLAVGSKG
jgi:N-dimethylarginine dimethylaminohydrolase